MRCDLVSHQLDAERAYLYAHEAYAEDEHQPDLLSPRKLEGNDKGDGQEKDHKVSDDVGVRVSDFDGYAEAFPFNRPVPDGLEGDAVDEGGDHHPDVACHYDDQDDIVADARPAYQEEASVQQQDRYLGAGEAGCVEQHGVPCFLNAGRVSSVPVP